MATIYKEYRPDSPVLFWLEFINKILYTIFIMMLIYLFYTIFYIYRRISTGKCRISVWHEYLDGFLREPDNIFLLLFHIDVYYENDNDRNRDQDRYQNIYKNLHFHLVSNPRNLLETTTIHNANTQLSIDQPTSIRNTDLTIEEYTPTEQLISPNQTSTVPKPSNSSSKHGFSVKNIDEIDQRFICQSCKLVLRDPYQLICGHRKCQPCIHVLNNMISCIECSESSATNEVWLDKGCRYELERLLIVCTDCDWTGPLEAYQEHFDENHPNECITCFICTQQVERSKIQEHYLTGAHQRVLPNILLNLYKTKMENDQRQKLEFSEVFHDLISIVSNDVTMINNNIQRINDEFHSHQKSIQVHIQEFLSVNDLAKENEHCLSGMRASYDLSGQEIESLQQRLVDGHVISFDGTLTWKISDVEQKMNDAKFERQRSIYSSEFYSSREGYKMCLRLFLNGVNNARGTHLSVFFMVMRGEYDAVLNWPFSFKVTITLLDQSVSEDNKRHFNDFFWPDIRSDCFQRPRSEMNEAYGIENFVSLEQFRQNQHRYVKNDTMFIKVEVDFTSVPPEMSSDSGGILLNDEQHTDTNDDDLMRKFLFMLESADRVQ